MLRVHLLFIAIKSGVCFSKRKGQQSEAGALTLKPLESARDPDGSVVTSPRRNKFRCDSGPRSHS